MIQWIRGRLTASYVGEPSTLVLPSGGASQRRYRPRVFRAAVRDVELITSPPDACPPRLEDATAEPETVEPAAFVASPEPVDFRQLRIDEAHVTGVRGGGTYFLGALFDVRVNDLRLSYPTEKAGRAYGLMTGTVTACLVLPALRAPELAPESKLIESAALPLSAGELHVVGESADAGVSADRSDSSSQVHLANAQPDASEPFAESEGARAGVALAPWLALGGAICLGLALSCGALPATLWAVFMLPTVVARRLFASMLPDTRGIHIAGAVLVALQLVCLATLLHGWSAGGCRELAIVPLLGVIAALFPAGLMPSPIPLAINAASLALVLFGWCSAADGPCGKGQARADRRHEVASSAAQDGR